MLKQRLLNLRSHQSINFLRHDPIPIPNHLLQLLILGTRCIIPTSQVTALDPARCSPDLLAQIEHLLASVIAGCEEGTLADGRDPVLVPQEGEKFCVEGGFEMGDFERVVLGSVGAKVFDLIEWDALVLAAIVLLVLWRGVSLGVCAEGTDLDFARGYGTVGINNDSDEGVTK